MKKLIHVLLLSALCASNIYAKEAPSTERIIAAVNIHGIMPIQDPTQLSEGAKEWQNLIEKVQTELTNRTTNLDKKSKQLERLYQEAQKKSKSKLTSENSLGSLKEEIVSLQNQIETDRRLFEEVQQEKFKQIYDMFSDKVQKAVQKVAHMLNIKIVTPVALYVDPEYDITEDVKKELDKDFAASQKAAKPTVAAA
jgi:Skp family chaperone for outer membrane proteins